MSSIFFPYSKRPRWFGLPNRMVPVLALAIALAGCGPKQGGHDQAKEEAHAKEDGHSHDEESPSGASFKAGKGIMLAEETFKNLGLETVEVKEQKLPNLVPLTVQVFGEKHRHLSNSDDHTGCDVQGSGFLSTNGAALVKAGQTVQLLQTTNNPLGGVVLAVQKALGLGESEVVIGISNAATVLKPGEFIPARIRLPRDEPVMVVPESALLRTSEGTFVYVVNGDAYYRTAVKTGAETDGLVEINDGLLTSDQVVTRPVQTLWLIELRATKGGGHSH